MFLNFKSISIIPMIALLLTSCESKTTVETKTNKEAKEVVQSNNPKKGKHVSNNLVCMVNDAYMGKEQIEVPFEGEIYYGCCKMCEERIPKDEKVRYAIDPFSLKKISKASAYIVIIGDNNEVAYFENESNYQSFLAENK